MRVLEPTSVTILPTSRCTARCRHCSMSSSPDREEVLSLEELEHIIRQIFAELTPKAIVFSGGESTLLGQDLHAALRLCKTLGPDTTTRLVTNAFWATSEAAARETLSALRDAGLEEINISSDDYHLPFISLQKVRWAFGAALELGFATVALSNAYGPESWLTPERLNDVFGGGELKMRFDASGRSIAHVHEEGETLVMLSNAELQRLGRTGDALARSELPTDVDLEGLADQIGGCPWVLRSPAVSASGHFVSCCGFEVDHNPILDYGDLAEEPLGEILDRADDDLITNMIAFLGPVRIRRLLGELAPGETSFPAETYRSYCEVCTDLVSIEQNREALYRHQSAFVDVVTAARRWVQENYTDADGRVRLPTGRCVNITDLYVKPALPEGGEQLLSGRGGQEERITLVSGQVDHLRGAREEDERPLAVVQVEPAEAEPR